MPIRVEFSTEKDILIARASGNFDSSSDEQFDRTVAGRCERTSLRKVLVDFRNVEGLPSKTQSYKSGSKLSERGIGRDIVLAFLDRPEFREANKFYQLVATNRGYSVEHFYAEDEAMAWLIAQN